MGTALRSRLLIPLLLCAAPALAQPRGAPQRCHEACTRLVADERQRAVVCGRCLTDAERGAWVLRLYEFGPGMDQLGPILADDDWQVRWGAVRVLAKVRGFDEQRQLATWVVEGKGLLPCLTAVHLAGSKGRPLEKLFEGTGPMGPSALGLCRQQKDELKNALEVDLYSGDALVQREALAHLSAFLQQPPTRVVLDAMAGRPDGTDPVAAALLLDDAEAKVAAAGAALLKAARPEDKPRVDRLLAVFSHLLDVQRPRLKSKDVAQRREAVLKLAVLGPLSAGELEQALDDPDAKVARAAARGLALGEGKTLAAYAAGRARSAARLPLEQRLKWVALAGASNDADCLEVLGELADDAKQEEAVREAAVAAVGPCAGPKAMPALTPRLKSGPPWAKAGAMAALGAVPRSSEAAKWCADGLSDADPRVQAAAAASAGPLRLTAKTGAVSELLARSPHEAVRAAAARALGELGGPGASGRLSAALKGDAAAAVRRAAGEALGELGGNEALAALKAAAKNDPDPQVKVVAAASLRKLGLQETP